MRKLFTLLVSLLALAGGSGSPMFAGTSQRGTNFSTPSTATSTAITLLTIENDNWTSALDITNVHPDGSFKNVANEQAVDIVPTNCTGLGPLPEFTLKSGQVKHFDGFGKNQCNVSTFGLVNISARGGTANYYTAAMYTDTATGQKSRIDIPAFSAAIPVPTSTSDDFADVQRVTNGYDGRSSDFGLFAKNADTYVTIDVYDDQSKLLNREPVFVTKRTFYTLQTKVLFGRAEIRTGNRVLGCPGCEARGEVYAVQFDGYTNGGAPRVEIPPISHSTGSQ